jgi:hypothetical protein
MAEKADTNGPFKEFVLEDWLREGAKGLRNEFKIDRSSGSKIRSRMRKASREQLLAMRNLIDKAIEYIDKQETEVRQA